MPSKSNESLEEIMRIIYIKLMRLKTTFYPVWEIARNINFENELPDIRTGLINTYTIDFITTVNGLFTSGVYSFDSVFKNDEDYKKLKYLIRNYSIGNEKRVNVFEIRKHQICHFVEKMNQNDIYLVFSKSNYILEDIISFYDKACKKIDVDVSKFAYKPEGWESFTEEIDLFREIIHSCDMKLTMMNFERNKKKIKGAMKNAKSKWSTNKGKFNRS